MGEFDDHAGAFLDDVPIEVIPIMSIPSTLTNLGYMYSVLAEKQRAKGNPNGEKVFLKIAHELDSTAKRLNEWVGPAMIEYVKKHGKPDVHPDADFPKRKKKGGFSEWFKGGKN